MKPLVLYCKSYSTDLKRVLRLAKSIEQYNQEKLPFYVSVPLAERPLFAESLAGLDVQLLNDEDILQASPGLNLQQVSRMPGAMSQQVVKSEFWRLNLAQAYLCLDSDAIFIRPFGLADFTTVDGVPYTTIDEAHDLLEGALQHGSQRVLSAFEQEALKVQEIFGRKGRAYSFGPFPLVWHRAVWESLEQNYLIPKKITFGDAIALAPIESRWYGESLLAYKAVPLMPSQALFKVYHYAWQFDKDMRRGVTQVQLSKLYCGVILQSAWERNMDWPKEGGNWWSRAGRRMRRRLGRI